MRFVLAHPPGRAAEREYAASLLLDGEVTLREEARDGVQLTLAGEDGALTFPDRFFSTDDWLRPESLGREEGDPFATAFVLATAYRDIVRNERDAHERHVAAGSVAYPALDECRTELGARIASTWPRAALREPGPGSVLPSHDVDWPRSPPGRVRSTLGAARRDPGEALARASALVRGRDPNDTFDLIMDLSEQRGLRSAFFFIAGGTPPRDGDYSLDDPWIRALLRRINQRGHEIGLHGSYETMNDPERLAAELANLQRACRAEGIEQDTWGGRQHYLRWDPATTWRAYAEAGLDYDTSAAYAGQAGFRLGTSREIPVFDVVAGRALPLRERPLVAMEVTLLDHMGLAPDAALRELRGLKERALAHGGHFTLLWHNSRLVAPRERRLYREALDA